MPIEKVEVYCMSEHADFQNENEDYCLLDTISETGKLIPAEQRPEAAAKAEFYNDEIVISYIKRSRRGEIFSPRGTNHINEHKKQEMGLKKWDFRKVNAEALMFYKRHLVKSSESSLSRVTKSIIASL